MHLVSLDGVADRGRVGGMTAIVIDRTARKEHACGRCRLPIRPGARYREWKLPPGDSTVGNAQWWRDRVHFDYGDCVSNPCGGRCPMVSDEDRGYRACCACDVVLMHEVRQDGAA